MKNLYISIHGNILVDNENNDVSSILSTRNAISNVYRICEPVHIVSGSGDNKVEFDADDGDIVITFYESKFKNNPVLVKCPKWYENLKQYDDDQQRMKEEWAAKYKDVCEQNVDSEPKPIGY